MGTSEPRNPMLIKKIGWVFLNEEGLKNRLYCTTRYGMKLSLQLELWACIRYSVPSVEGVAPLSRARERALRRERDEAGDNRAARTAGAHLFANLDRRLHAAAGKIRREGRSPTQLAKIQNRSARGPRAVRIYPPAFYSANVPAYLVRPGRLSKPLSGTRGAAS